MSVAGMFKTSVRFGPDRLRCLPSAWTGQQRARPSSSSSSSSSSAPSSATKSEWSRAVTDAEKIVGYGTSYLSLRYLLSDEMSNVAFHVRKLVGTNHPLLKTVKQLLYTGTTNMQTRGLIMLLVSKVAGVETDEANGVSSRQRSLAEITEMIHTAHQIHKGVLNVSHLTFPDVTTQQDMEFGNKIAILCGDYLLANVCASLAALRNHKVLNLMGSTVGDLSRLEFTGTRDGQGNLLPAADISLEFWEQKNFLAVGSLMAKSCQSALELAGHSQQMQSTAFLFGKEMALAWQAHSELHAFVDIEQHFPGDAVDLTSAPVMFHLQEDPCLLDYIKQHWDNLDKINYKKVHKAVSEGQGVQATRQLCQQHAVNALEVLSDFEESKARSALENIVHTLNQ